MSCIALFRNLCAVTLASCALSAIASPLYLADHDASITDQALNPYGVSVAQVGQDGTLGVTSSWRHGSLIGGEFRDAFRGPIAVAGGHIDVAGPYNHRYNNDGTGKVSTICTTPAGPCEFVGQGLGVDGATDGTYNYTAALVVGGGGYGVWRTNRTWGQGSVLFELGTLVDSGERTFGITYDADRQSLWIQVGDFDGFGSFRFLELGLDGTLKSQFVPSFFQPPYDPPNVAAVLAGALAMDYEDDSLWWIPFGDLNSSLSNGVIRLDRQGHQLSYIPLRSDWPSRGVIGAEFELPQVNGVPEPSSLLLVFSALSALMWGFRQTLRA